MTPTLADRPFYGRFAWAYDLLSERSVASECGHVAAALARHGVAPGPGSSTPAAGPAATPPNWPGTGSG